MGQFTKANSTQPMTLLIQLNLPLN